MSVSFENLLAAMKSQANIIQGNRQQRNAKYLQCIDAYVAHLNQEISQFKNTEQVNEMAKQQISAAFASVFDRVLTTADKTLNAMKHTYLAKRNFWESAIEESLYIDSVELKAELYKMKLKADDLYLDAVEKQKFTKHPSYDLVAGKTTKKKDELTAFQATNKAFEEQVNHGSNTLTSWANIQRRTTYKQEFVQPRTPVSPEFPVQDGILNKFMLRQH